MNIDKTELLAGVDDPETYYCTVWLYTVHHSEMAIRVISTPDETSTTQKFYWIFTGVLYHKGPLKWQGADFSFDDSECINIVKKIYPTRNIPEELIRKDFYRLFKFIDKISGSEIKILASGVLRTENIPKL